MFAFSSVSALRAHGDIDVPNFNALNTLNVHLSQICVGCCFHAKLNTYWIVNNFSEIQDETQVLVLKYIYP